MKLRLNKKKLKNLSKDAQILPNNMTPNIGGGAPEPDTDDCQTHVFFCGDQESSACGNGGTNICGGVSGYGRDCDTQFTSRPCG